MTMTPVVKFLLVLLLAVLASAKVTIQGFLSRQHIRTAQDSLWFNSLLFVVIAVLFLILFPVGELNLTLMAYASLMALTNIGFQCCYSMALQCGPVSLTVLIGNFNILLTTGFSCLFLGDPLYPTQLVAVAFLITAMFLTSGGDKKEEKKANRKWLFLSLTCMACTAAFGIGQKLFLASPAAQLPNAQQTEVLMSYVLSAVMGFIIYAINARKGEKSPLGFKKSVVLYALAIGFVLGVYQRLNIFTMAVVEGTFHFPTYAGLQSLTMTLVGIVLFKDRLSKKQMLGVICGIISVVLMNMRIGMPF